MKPIITTDVTELMQPGVQVIIDPDDAAEMGLVEDDALTEIDAWESNQDDHHAMGGAEDGR